MESKMLSNTRAWIENKHLAFQAKAWLNASDNQAELACRCMYHLNRYVYKSRTLETKVAYTLKNELVKWLYLNGYCVSARKYQQNKVCWTCGGEGCYRCDDTGIYSSHTLWSFVFSVDDRKYVWHQPSRMVGWSVIPTNPETGIFKDLSPMSLASRRYWTPKVRKLYRSVIDQFLRKNGIAIQWGDEGLGKAILKDLDYLRYRLDNTWVGRACSSTRRALRRLCSVGNDDRYFDDEIPF